MEKLKALCKEYLDGLREGTIVEDDRSDLRHYIFEAAMETFYGKEVWEEINSLHQHDPESDT